MVADCGAALLTVGKEPIDDVVAEAVVVNGTEAILLSQCFPIQIM